MVATIATAISMLLAAENEVTLEKSSVVRRSREMMHTKVTIALSGSKPTEERESAFEAAFDVFERIDQVMNEWRPGSPLEQINAKAGHEAVTAPADLCEVIQLALDGAKRTQGLFDPTWASLRELWKFGEDSKEEVPSDEAIKAACALVSWKDVEVKPLPKPTREASCTVKLKKPGMKLGLGGLVKGWGVDEVAKELRRRGYRDFFVQAGGDLYLAGKNGDRAWKAGIRDPRGPAEKTFARAELTDTAFSTSGDYERFFVKNGVRYHHLIDPRSCRPATASISATVLAKSATDAELLTKSVFIVGGKKGLALAKSFGATAVIVDPRGEVAMSEALKGKLEIWPIPSFQDAGTPP
jgi:FAD:protein FMN transferase